MPIALADVRSSQLHAPDFRLHPEHAIHRLVQNFGYQDINFENFPVFPESTPWKEQTKKRYVSFIPLV